MIGRYNVSDKKMQALCLAACDAKSFLWGIFFGWRKTWYDNDVEVMEFLLPQKVWNDLLLLHRCFFQKDGDGK